MGYNIPQACLAATLSQLPTSGKSVVPHDNNLCTLSDQNLSQISDALGAVGETPDWGIIYPISGSYVVTFSVITFTA